MTPLDGSVEDVAHEGEKLQRLLERNGRTQADLARAMGITRGAVYHYTQEEKWERRRWMRLRGGLAKLNINPLELRPTDIEATPTLDLTPLVEEWDHAHLDALCKILESDELARGNVLAYVRGALRHSKKIK